MQPERAAAFFRGLSSQVDICDGNQGDALCVDGAKSQAGGDGLENLAHGLEHESGRRKDAIENDAAVPLSWGPPPHVSVQ